MDPSRIPPQAACTGCKRYGGMCILHPPRPEPPPCKPCIKYGPDGCLLHHKSYHQNLGGPQSRTEQQSFSKIESETIIKKKAPSKASQGPESVQEDRAERYAITEQNLLKHSLTQPNLFKHTLLERTLAHSSNAPFSATVLGPRLSPSLEQPLSLPVKGKSRELFERLSNSSSANYSHQSANDDMHDNDTVKEKDTVEEEDTTKEKDTVKEEDTLKGKDTVKDGDAVKEKTIDEEITNHGTAEDETSEYRAADNKTSKYRTSGNEIAECGTLEKEVSGEETRGDKVSEYRSGEEIFEYETAESVGLDHGTAEDEVPDYGTIEDEIIENGTAEHQISEFGTAEEISDRGTAKDEISNYGAIEDDISGYATAEEISKNTTAGEISEYETAEEISEYGTAEDEITGNLTAEDGTSGDEIAGEEAVDHKATEKNNPTEEIASDACKLCGAQPRTFIPRVSRELMAVASSLRHDKDLQNSISVLEQLTSQLTNYHQLQMLREGENEW